MFIWHHYLVPWYQHRSSQHSSVLTIKQNPSFPLNLTVAVFISQCYFKESLKQGTIYETSVVKWMTPFVCMRYTKYVKQTIQQIYSRSKITLSEVHEKSEMFHSTLASKGYCRRHICTCIPYYARCLPNTLVLLYRNVVLWYY